MGIGEQQPQGLPCLLQPATKHPSRAIDDPPARALKRDESRSEDTPDVRAGAIFAATWLARFFLLAEGGNPVEAPLQQCGTAATRTRSHRRAVM